ncbi:MAG: AhpC/TSA family protein [Flavobacteriaceae bacterium]|nr:AhpC/TSA family protein [Flavobacteriaceae bacterium]
MTRFTSLLFFPFLLFIISCTKKPDLIFTLEGKISPVKTNYVLLIENTDIERKATKIVDTIFLDNKGDFKIDFNLEPNLYTLQFNMSNQVVLAIDKGQKIKIEITNANLKDFKSTITGSKDTEALLAYETLRKRSLDSLVQSVRREVKKVKKSENPDEEKIKDLEQLEIKNYSIHLAELNAFIKSKMGNTIGIYATSIRWKGEENLSFFDALTSDFESAHPNLKISVKLREKVTRLQQTSIGGTVINIEMKDVKGGLVSLSSVKKKYTLIDFWASWCGPCRSESKGLNELYEKYKDKGFEIYGVSLDTKRDKWMDALIKDHRIWPNVSSLEGFKTQAAFDFTVTSLPMNYIIDENNKIVGKNLHGNEIENLIARLLK